MRRGRRGPGRPMGAGRPRRGRVVAASRGHRRGGGGGTWPSVGHLYAAPNHRVHARDTPYTRARAHRYGPRCGRTSRLAPDTRRRRAVSHPCGYTRVRRGTARRTLPVRAAAAAAGSCTPAASPAGAQCTRRPRPSSATPPSGPTPSGETFRRGLRDVVRVSFVFPARPPPPPPAASFRHNAVVVRDEITLAWNSFVRPDAVDRFFSRRPTAVDV